MIASFGLAALWFAAALALLQLVAGGLSLTRNTQAVTDLVRPVAMAQGMMAALAFAVLIYLFCVTDLSVLLVAKNAHSATPFLDKFARAWGTLEGALLLWVTLMGLAGGFIALVERRLPERTMLATLAAQAFVSIGIYAFLLFVMNPFVRANPAPKEGLGLNQLLQDAGLAFQPLALYTGYVGLSVAFSFMVGALITRQIGPAFARAMRPWVLGAWIFLTVGITTGSFLAYHANGRADWWPGDSATNASVLSWLTAIALLHSNSALAARDALRSRTIALGALTFAMSLVGTFHPFLTWAMGKQPWPDFHSMKAALLAAMLVKLPWLGIALAPIMALASLVPLRGRKLRMATLPHWGVAMAHLGVAAALFGIAADRAFTVERLVVARQGDTVQVGPWQAELARVDPVAGPNWTALQATLQVRYDGGSAQTLMPQARTFWSPQHGTNAAAVATRWNGQLYAVIGDEVSEDRWQLRLWWKPFVTLIWYGGLLIALGGLLALIGRVQSDLRRVIAKDKIAYRRMRQGR
ncbi:MAG: cytochrome c-type biogenesis CcmF C-terminal domain-containing protein [Novosphingobium sp.]